MNGKRRYLVCIDGGGTKTGFCVSDLATKEVRCINCGGGNYKTHGIDVVRERIREGLWRLLPSCSRPGDEIAYLVMGISGCDSSRDLAVYEEIMLDMGIPSERLFICNDSEMIFRSLSDAPGICIVAGTGSIAFAFGRDGSVKRAGGWGAPVSDEGSGWWIGAQAVRGYLDWVDGRGDYQPIFDRFREEHPGISDEDRASLLASLPASGIAKWAKPVLDSTEDAFCGKIAESAASLIAGLIAAVFSASDLEGEKTLNIVESGSLFISAGFEERVQRCVRTALLGREIRFRRSSGVPASDGIRLAERQADKLDRTRSTD